MYQIKSTIRTLMFMWGRKHSSDIELKEERKKDTEEFLRFIWRG